MHPESTLRVFIFITNMKKEEFKEWYSSETGLLSEWIDFPGDEFTEEEYENYQDHKDKFIEYMDERISEVSIIGYRRAMDFLTENDTSLSDSFEIASELGYDVKKLDSELLATLLLKDILRKDLYNTFQ